jgi:gluconolactonase
MTPAPREVATGLRFPEGPVAMPDGSVILVEIESQHLTRVKPGGAIERIAHLGGGPNGAAIGPDGRAYICNNGGLDWHRSAEHGIRPIGAASDYRTGRIECVDLASGKVDTLYEASDKHRLCGPNDIDG